jgi:hypothetical protein
LVKPAGQDGRIRKATQVRGIFIKDATLMCAMPWKKELENSIRTIAQLEEYIEFIPS